MPVDSLRLRQPKIQYVKLTSSGYTSNVVQFSRNIERQTNLVVIGIVVGQRAALTDHFLFNSSTNPGLRHNNYDALSGNSLDSNSGVMLGTVACAPRFLASTTLLSQKEGFYPWPGRMNDVARLTLLAQAIAANDPRAEEVRQRLALALSFPETIYPCTCWPLEGGKQFIMNMRRLPGGSTLTDVFLVCVKLPDDIYRNACQFAELPNWASMLLNVPATAGISVPQNLQVNAKDGYGFLFKQVFLNAYSNNGAGTVTYDETYAAATSDQLAYENQQLYDGIAQEPVPLSIHYPAQLADYEKGRAIDILMNPRSQLVFTITRDSATAQTRDLYFAAYGLVAEAEAGLLQAQGPSILL